MPTLRVLSYDLRSADRDAAALDIRNAAPDVVWVRHAPHRLRWRSKCAALARTSGLVVAGGGRRAGANLVMSTLSVDVEAAHDLPNAVLALLRYSGTPFALLGSRVDVSDSIARLVPDGTQLIAPPAGDGGALLTEVELA